MMYWGTWWEGELCRTKIAKGRGSGGSRVSCEMEMVKV